VIKDTQEFVVVEGDGHRFGAMDASLACCALETRSALLSKRRWVDEELDGLVLLVSGTISQKLAPALLDLVSRGFALNCRTLLSRSAPAPPAVVHIGIPRRSWLALMLWVCPATCTSQAVRRGPRRSWPVSSAY
jgi:hypothetical protein